MKNIKRTMTLKAHLWLYFCTFAVSIMAILWILQILLLGVFFNSMKLNEMKKVGQMIEEQYDVNKENFYEFWFEHSFRSGMFAHLVTENGEIVRNFNTTSDVIHREENHSSGGRRNDIFPRFDGGFIAPENFEEFITKVNSGRDSAAFVDDDNIRGAHYAVYGSLLGEKNGEKIYLFLISPLERTDSTRKVLQTQLIIASGISILLALLLAYFIARRISKPIEKTTVGAQRLASGDYSVKFRGGSYSEIDKLAGVLNHTASELSKTEELRRDLISNVSHDLRTPLTIIKSYAELIRDISGANEEKRIKHTGVIVDEANNLSLLVNDMLDLSKIQSGTMAMNIRPFNLKELTEATVARFEYYRENCGIEFILNLEGGDLYVLGDEKRIEQVIYNLVANAVNYTGEDNKVSILLEDCGDLVRFSVTDTGCGIAEEELPRVWDKYYKTSEKHRRETVGTGIGLSIVKNILLAHNAPFGVDSIRGSGSTFWFGLRHNNSR